MRVRNLGVAIGAHPTGTNNAITDVRGVRVGHTTLQGGDVNTGVTVVVPHDDIWTEPVFAGSHVLNGSGELTGLEWIRESGELTTAIGLTNTHSVGVVRDGLVAEQVRVRGDGIYWSLPVVGETYDGFLNDINGFHVRPEHVRSALESASDGMVAEGNVGGGTGMICHGFKGGIGTASRVLGYTVGVLVQANHGRRDRLRINGIPMPQPSVPVPALPPGFPPGSGSIIVIVATDAPLLPHQCQRLAQRSALAVGRLGGTGEQYSGDLMLAFSTGNRGIPPYGVVEDIASIKPEIPLRMVGPQLMDLLFDLTIEATEEAIVNAMVAAETVTGHKGYTAHAIDRDQLRSALLLNASGNEETP
jgi:D-aminopeptidase